MTVFTLKQFFLGNAIFSTVLILLLVKVGAAEVVDPQGDHDGRADILGLRAETMDEVGARILITYAQQPVAPLVGYIFIDLDQDPTTGAPGVANVPGIEVLVRYRLTTTEPTSSGVRVDVTTISGSQIFFPPKTNKLKFVIKESTIRITFSKDLLGDITVFDFFVATDVGEDGDSLFDRLPDAGVVDFSSGMAEVKISNPGEQSVHSMTSDAQGDPAFPDLADLLVTVFGDRLRVTISYHHSVENKDFPSRDSLTGHVYFDTDRFLRTGFGNAGNVPPLLGADYALRFIIDPRAGLEASFMSFKSRAVGRSDPDELMLGLPFAHDMMAWRSGSQVFFDIPLSMLGHSNGEMFMRIDSDSASSSTLDQMPDRGILRSDAARTELPFICTRSVSDIMDGSDSLDNTANGEILGVSACLSERNGFNENVLLLQVDYNQLRAANDAAVTSIYLDTDQDSDTGLAVSNDDTTIGADFILRYSIKQRRFTRELLIEIQLQQVGQQPQVFNQLTSILFGEPGLASTSIPMELLDRDDGSLRLLVETGGNEGRLDITPDQGSIVIQ